jgi:hypothetical protein
MLSRYTDKNKYGGYTWHIKLDSLFHIFINGTTDNSYVVDFKEWKWISYKTRFSFVSTKDFTTTVRDAYDRVFDYFQGHKDYLWTEQQKNNKLHQTLDLLEKSGGPITEIHSETQEQTRKISKPINLIRGVGIDDNKINQTTAQSIIEKYGKPKETINHNNYSLELRYPKHGMSFFHKLDDPLKIIYFMMATGEISCETETGLLFDSSLTLQQVFRHYGMEEPKWAGNSDEAYIKYPGIMFYAIKDDLTQLQADEISIKKIGVLKK